MVFDEALYDEFQVYMSLYTLIRVQQGVHDPRGSCPGSEPVSPFTRRRLALAASQGAIGKKSLWARRDVPRCSRIGIDEMRVGAAAQQTVLFRAQKRRI